jgi:hypothetical protein
MPTTLPLRGSAARRATGAALAEPPPGELARDETVRTATMR